MRRALLAVLAVMAAALPAAGGVNPAARATLVSDAGEVVPATAESTTASFGVSPSWRGSGLLSQTTAGSVERSTQSKPVSFPQDGSIIGFDGRVRVRHTDDFPARATVFIVFNQGSTALSCTGWLIGKDAVATAGHCLNAGPGFGNLWSTDVAVYPGRNGESSPYGSCGAKKLWTNKSWLKNGDPEHDYGAIKLDCDIGQVTGWYGFFWQKGSLIGAVTKTRGYPNDKRFGTQWLSKNCGDAAKFKPCHIMISQPRQLYYDNDTMGGQSGSAVYERLSDICDPCAMAIHGYAADGQDSYNHGARITQSVYNFLRDVAKMQQRPALRSPLIHQHCSEKPFHIRAIELLASREFTTGKTAI